MEDFDFFKLFEKAIKIIRIFSDELKKHGSTEGQFLINFLAECLPKNEFF